MAEPPSAWAGKTAPKCLHKALAGASSRKEAMVQAS